MRGRGVPRADRITRVDTGPDACVGLRYAGVVMKLRALSWLIVGIVGIHGCSGSTTSGSAAGAGGGGGTGVSGGSGGNPGSCPEDLQVRNGDACAAVASGCPSGACVLAQGAWLCAMPCPCAVGWFCAVVGDREACVPDSLAGCLPSGTGGTGGVGGGGSGGTGVGGVGGTSTGGTGVGGTSTGGNGGVGGAGGSSGGGPCDGDPSCPGTESSFCSSDGLRLLTCSPSDSCPAVTECPSFCPACRCHMAPPVNGVLVGTCDTCTNNSECDSNLQCLDHPMFPGSGAKTCVAP